VLAAAWQLQHSGNFVAAFDLAYAVGEDSDSNWQQLNAQGIGLHVIFAALTGRGSASPGSPCEKTMAPSA